jgi:hypothetical protein
MNSFLKSELKDNNIIFTILKEYPTREEWENSKMITNDWYNYIEKNNLQVGFIFNLNNLTYMRPTYLLEWKDIFQEKKEKTRKYIIASCVIIEYNIVRQFVNLFFKAYDPIRPTRFVKDIEEGEEFIKSCISK